MARIITLTSGKGGTGKTTVTVNLGTALAQLGKRTIALDADVTMANLGLMLGLEEKKITLHEVLADERRIRQAIYKCPAGLKVVPCGMSLNGIRKVRLERLKKVISDLAANADFLLVDSPSGIDHDSINALTIAQEAILIVNPDFTSVLEALKVKLIAERLHVKPLGSVINRASEERTDLSQKEVGNVLDLPVLGIVPEDIEIRRAAAFGESVVVSSPNSKAAKAFKKLAERIVKSKTAEHEVSEES